MLDELAKLLCRCNGPVMSMTLHMLSDDQPTKRALVPALHERSRLQPQGGSPAELLGSSNHRDGEGFLVNGGLQHLAVHARDPVLLLQTCLPSASAVWERCAQCAWVSIAGSMHCIQSHHADQPSALASFERVHVRGCRKYHCQTGW